MWAHGGGLDFGGPWSQDVIRAMSFNILQDPPNHSAIDGGSGLPVSQDALVSEDPPNLLRCFSSAKSLFNVVAVALALCRSVHDRLGWQSFRRHTMQFKSSLH